MRCYLLGFTLCCKVIDLVIWHNWWVVLSPNLVILLTYEAEYWWTLVEFACSPLIEYKDVFDDLFLVRIILRSCEFSGKLRVVLPHEDNGEAIPESLILLPAHMGHGCWWCFGSCHTLPFHVPSIPTPFCIQEPRGCSTSSLPSFVQYVLGVLIIL